MRFHTENSTYEVDQQRQRIRRLSGVNEPTVRQGQDGQWRNFADLSAIHEGSAVSIVWRYDDTDDGTIARMTHTSPVTTIEP